MPKAQLKQRPDGNYVARYHNKYFYGKTQSEVMRKREAYIA